MDHCCIVNIRRPARVDCEWTCRRYCTESTLQPTHSILNPKKILCHHFSFLRAENGWILRNSHIILNSVANSNGALKTKAFVCFVDTFTLYQRSFLIIWWGFIPSVTGRESGTHYGQVWRKPTRTQDKHTEVQRESNLQPSQYETPGWTAEPAVFIKTLNCIQQCI